MNRRKFGKDAGAALQSAEIVRRDRQRALEIAQRLLIPRLSRQDLAAAYERFCEQGCDRERPAVILESPIVLSQPGEDIRPVGVQVRMRRISGDGLVAAGERFALPLQVAERLAPIAGGIDVIGLQLERAVEAKNGLRFPAQGVQERCAVIQRGGLVGLQRQCAVIAVERFGKSFGGVQCRGPIRERPRMIGFERQDAVIVDDRFIDATKDPQQAGAIEERVRVFRIVGKRLIEESDSLVGASTLRLDETQEMESIRVGWRLCQHGAEGLLCFIQPAALLHLPASSEDEHDIACRAVLSHDCYEPCDNPRDVQNA